MDKVIVTALLVIAGVTAAALVTTTLTPIVGSSSRSIVESQKDLSIKITTDVEIVTVHSTDSTTVNAWVKNVGGANITQLSLSDIFIGSNDQAQFYVLSYDPTGNLADNNWTTSKTGPWNQGETVELSIKLNNASALIKPKIYFLRFATSNGIQSDYQFKFDQ
ncbi:MAG: hypothetical protein ACJ0BB_03255 [Dehalococcoidia bacterium]